MDESAVAERFYDVDFVCEVKDSEEVEDRHDLTLSLNIKRRMGEGKFRRWPKYTFEYPNVPKQAVEDTKALMAGVIETIGDEGIELKPVAWEEDRVGASCEAISHDEMMVIEQFGIQLADDLGDYGFAHAETKCLKAERAHGVREKRGRGHFKKDWKSGKVKGPKDK